MRYVAEKQRIIDACLHLKKIEYFLGTWGNVSMRIGDDILLTPSKVNYETMQPEDIVIIDMDGNLIEGNRAPTSEKEVHRQIYLKRTDVHAIIHAHTTFAMAVSTLDMDNVPCLVEEMSQLLGGSIPLTKEYVPAQQHTALGEITAATIGDRNAVILRNHGSVTCGRDMTEAILSAQVTEKACKLYLFAHKAGHAFRGIPEPFIASERYRYLYSYGHENQ